MRSLIWSPDSKHFAMIRSDETKVQDLFVVDVLAQPRPKLERYKYEMPGEKNMPQYSLVVFNMEDKTWKTIETAAFKDQTLELSYKPMEKRKSPMNTAAGNGRETIPDSIFTVPAGT